MSFRESPPDWMGFALQARGSSLATHEGLGHILRNLYISDYPEGHWHWRKHLRFRVSISQGNRHGRAISVWPPQVRHSQALRCNCSWLLTFVGCLNAFWALRCRSAKATCSVSLQRPWLSV